MLYRKNLVCRLDVILSNHGFKWMNKVYLYTKT